MPRNIKTQTQMQAQINKLKSENEQLRLLFRVILDTAFLAVNGKEKPEILSCWQCGLTIPAGHLCADCGSREDKKTEESHE